MILSLVAKRAATAPPLAEGYNKLQRASTPSERIDLYGVAKRLQQARALLAYSRELALAVPTCAAPT
jgi:hypothetical protein